MADRDVEIAVVGTGPVGLAAALGLARAGWRVGLVGPEPAPADGRTAALLAPSVDWLEALGVWPALAAGTAPLRRLRIVDGTDSLFRPPPALFDSAEIGLPAFGWNVENAALVSALAVAVAGKPGIVRHRAVVERADPGPDAVELGMADGATLRAHLVVAADGRRSRLRDAAGIAARERRYPQVALTTLIRHERSHEDTSTEFHTRDGPFTLVPLPGRRSSLVWVTRPAMARRLAALPDAALSEAIGTQGARGVLGGVAIDGPRGTVPLGLVGVDRMAAARIALAGEAAHALPPIGAQGLNLGLADAAALVASVGRPGLDDPGSSAALAAYTRARGSDTRLRSLAVHGLNTALLSRFGLADLLRGVGLGLVGSVGPLRRAAMRSGFPGRGGAGLTGRSRMRRHALSAHPTDPL